ncbi:hypothetical protein EYF80_002560 [Liparis tanakae]|uniref:Uncharacterized protein n=1 Tax=Liparis tanakae TaxID=230148 RepID=A0A4Z2JAV9_9TELE|nr:hypothetical protein EYF80_002560 [Liparis tanakae]
MRTKTSNCGPTHNHNRVLLPGGLRTFPRCLADLPPGTEPPPVPSLPPYLSAFLPSKDTKSPARTQRAQVSRRREVLHSGHRSTATYRPSASSTDSTAEQPRNE